MVRDGGAEGPSDGDTHTSSFPNKPSCSLSQPELHPPGILIAIGLWGGSINLRFNQCPRVLGNFRGRTLAVL